MKQKAGFSILLGAPEWTLRANIIFLLTKLSLFFYQHEFLILNEKFKQ